MIAEFTEVTLPADHGELIITNASAIEGKYVLPSADLAGKSGYVSVSDVWLEGYSEIIELVWGTSFKLKCGFCGKKSSEIIF
ncbi:MAG: hypothetical protein LBT84_02630 [Spirochaetia bacterium]|jgi:hypothetical protein|nr:hypothetical protein [Spirochaetia bacterium]